MSKYCNKNYLSQKTQRPGRVRSFHNPGEEGLCRGISSRVGANNGRGHGLLLILSNKRKSKGYLNFSSNPFIFNNSSNIVHVPEPRKIKPPAFLPVVGCLGVFFSFFDLLFCFLVFVGSFGFRSFAPEQPFFQLAAAGPSPINPEF